MVTREIRWLIVQGLQKNQKHQIRIHQVKLKEFKFSTFISEKNHIYFKMNVQYMV